ncbi:hypothetical protein EYZ11_009679 [Aspergillus tanneri]|uniref:Uncharacterized protein n=1 Tax=Aspergillus tanneri TaxID=1220188 RepID=A0A4S3J7B2_9EURO|nr:hypothetical protein EYZ11_009679 [Aspergillus tanneri]
MAKIGMDGLDPICTTTNAAAAGPRPRHGDVGGRLNLVLKRNLTPIHG